MSRHNRPTRKTASTHRPETLPARRASTRKQRGDATKSEAADNRQLPYLPSRREIARRCREIQAGWTPTTRRMRDRYRVNPIVLTPIHVVLDLEPRQDAA